jgi:hypothetical protein
MKRRCAFAALAAVFLCACNTVTGLVLAAPVGWPRGWTPGERAGMCVLALDLVSGVLLGSALRSRKDGP